MRIIHRSHKEMELESHASFVMELYNMMWILISILRPLVV